MSSPPLEITDMPSIHYSSSFPRIFYKWNHFVWSLFEQHAFEIHSKCVYILNSFLLTAKSIVWTYHSWFIHSPRTFEYFQFLTVMNRAEQTFTWDFWMWTHGRFPGVDFLGCMFDFIKSCKLFSRVTGYFAFPPVQLLLFLYSWCW